jgi:hypothetical protein
MSTKTLVVEIRVPLPEGLFEASAVINNVQGAVAALQEAMEANEVEGFELTVDTVTKRAPRADNAAKPGRKPKAANGQAAASTATT